ncbi:MAG: lysophospholipid acyltransferase family protein [Candidatus Lambdaproteobacteria bacterium]|nr:lysophospholipid acyltransferase family protein [Candidatus Lambdaproteobacteria bacterium]
MTFKSLTFKSLTFKSLRRAIADRVYSALLILLLYAVGWSTRKTWINRHILQGLERQGQAYILGVWHDSLLYLMFVMRWRGLTTMASRSRDGEKITRIARAFGVGAVRGSRSEGALSATRELLRLLAAGRSLALMPDGPRGPRYVLKPGAVALAQRRGVPIVPLTCATLRRWEFGSWDRTKLPKPFARVFIHVGTPITVARDEEPEQARLRVERAMRQAVVTIERFAGTDLVAREPLLAEVAGQPPAER